MKHTLWCLFFSAVAAASFSGGTVHGFLIDESSFVHQMVWRFTLASVGLAAFCAWGLSGMLVSGREKLKYWLWFAGLTYSIYLFIVIFISQNYTVVILNYAPAMLFLMCITGMRYFRGSLQSDKFIFTGMILTFCAAAIQQLQISISAEYFDHNATYHTVQGIGLFYIFKGAREEIRSVAQV